MEFQDQKQRETYNKEINKLPAFMKEQIYPGSRIVVKLFKYDSMNKTKSGVIRPKQLERYSSDGKIASKLEDYEYKPQGIIVAIPTTAKKYMEENWDPTEIPTVGQVVAIDVSQMNPKSFIVTDRSVPIPDILGFVRVHPTHIDFIEPTTYEIEYE